MPFLVTVKRSMSATGRGWTDDVVVSRLAVATLEEAAGLYGTAPEGHDESMAERAARATAWDHIRTMPESGGTVGPLPDGTLIEVEHLSWTHLGHAADFRWQTRRAHEASSAILDAFNARHA